MDDNTTLVLEDEDGNEIEVEIIDTLEHEGKIYVAMMEAITDPEQLLDTDSEYYIFELVDGEGAQGFAPVEDEGLLDVLAEKFEAIFDSYDDDDEEDEES